MNQSTPPAIAPRAPVRRWKWRFIVAAVGTLAVAIAAAGAAFLRSQAALDWVVARAIAASEGRLTIEGAEGSLLSTVRVARIAWAGDDIDVEAQAMALTYRATDLLAGRFHVTGLGAHRIALTLKAPADAPTPMPQSLALPLEVRVENVGVERLEWRASARTGVLTGVAFDYAGGARLHSVEGLRVITEHGTFAGNAELGASAPFALHAALDFTGGGALADTHAAVKVSGSFESLVVEADGATRDAAVAARAVVAPFAPIPLVNAHIDARDVDLARFAPALPITRLTLAVDARPVAEGFAGTLDARNTEAGAIDTRRMPLAALASPFTWDGRELVLPAIVAELPGNARVTGRAAIPVDGAASRWQLDVQGLDLRKIQSTLATTRLTGTLAADVTEDVQSVRGDLAQADLSLSFAAGVRDRRISVERFRGRAGVGEATGHGRFALDGDRGFDAAIDAKHLDPSRFGAFPTGNLDGTLVAHGRLSPEWNVAADIMLAKGSRIDGVAVHGTARGSATPRTLSDVAAQLVVASAALTLKGNAGNPGDRLAGTIDVESLSDLRPTLVKYAGVPVPEGTAGTLHLRAALASEHGGYGLEFDGNGTDLQWGRTQRVASLRAKASIGTGGFALDPAANADRTLKFAVAARNVHMPQGDFASLAIDATGTLAHHAANLSVTGEGVDAQVTVSGGMQVVAGTTGRAWGGTIDALDNRGTLALSLAAPTPVEWSADRLHVGAAHLRIAEGRADLADFLWDNGKLTTRGAFSDMPVSALFRLAGRKPPLATTLVIAGDWSLAATPRLNGTLHIARERGDVYGTDAAPLDPGGLALGISKLTLDARFVDDEVSATAILRSLRAGNADASLAIAAAANTPAGNLPLDAPLRASLTADLPSLRLLQPWLSTAAAMDGNAHVDLAGRGTLRALELSGTMRGDDLRVDIPQYGLYLREGRLRARVQDNALLLDEMTFAGGNGRFTAQGTLARAPRDGADDPARATHVTWKAEKFRVINRPDFNFVVSGTGALAIENGKLALRGSVQIDEGHIDYAPTAVGTLGGDVVVAGQPRATDSGTALDLPLVLDLEVALGNNLRFLGEGLDTWLAGSIRLTTTPAGALAARGSIQAINGTYFAFGQRLTIERGELIFDGPPANPALNIVAVRRNLSVEAGVELTGTARVPRVRLVSNPPVPDGEKLSWLVTGQGLDRASRADVAALGAAWASLLGKGQRPITTTIANSIGLDEISLRESRTATTSGTATQVVAFGKRISDRLTLVYEQGLSVANNALRIEYALSRTLTLRAEAGVVSSLGLYFRRNFD